MTQAQTLRLLVNERLTAAADEIFALFERTVAEYEAELRRSNEENQWKQQLLDSVLKPKVLLYKVEAVAHSPSQGPGQNQKNTQAPQIKEEPEEQRIQRLDGEQRLPGPAPGIVSGVKTESPVVQQIELKEETQREDISSKLNVLLETEGDSNNDDGNNWKAPVSCSSTQTETKAFGDHCLQAHIRSESTQETLATVDNGNMSETVNVAERKNSRAGRRFQCSICLKKYRCRADLRKHGKVHTAEKTFICPICNRVFAQKRNFETHKRRHTGNKPFSCLICKKAFFCQRGLKSHHKSHTGEKPFSCSVCEKRFVAKGYLRIHMRLHTGERPYSCDFCGKTFIDTAGYKCHLNTHTGEKPHCCTVCVKSFNSTTHLKRHMRTHTGEKPYSCSVCNQTFTQSGSLRTHVKKKHVAMFQLLSDIVVTSSNHT